MITKYNIFKETKLNETIDSLYNTEYKGDISYDDFLSLYFSLKISDKDIKHLKDLDIQYGKIFKSVDLDYNRKLTNLKEEREIFFKHLEEDKRYNPIFKHESKKFNAVDLLKKAITLQNKFKVFESFLSPYYIENLQILIDFLNLITLDKNSQEYVNKIYEMYPKPSQELLQQAEEMIKVNNKSYESNGDDNIDAKEMQKRMKEVLQELGYHKWDVIIKNDMTARISVSDTDFQIHINKNSNFSERDFHSLVAHEIKTHVGRAYYGDKTGLNLFRIGLKDEIELNEGLAIFNSLQVKEPKPDVLFNICFYTLICGQVDKMDFYDLFQYGKKFIKDRDKSLFAKISRLKRVCKDTSTLVGDTYHTCYLSGYLKVLNTDASERKNILKFNVGAKDYENIPKIKAFLTINGFIDKNF